MLFNSNAFVFAFLPLCLVGFYVVGKINKRPLSVLYLIVASLFFYAWWDPRYVALLALSIFVNYVVGRRVGRDAPVEARLQAGLRKEGFGPSQRGQRSRSAAGAWSEQRDKKILLLGIAVNLGLLGYFKYANFFVGNVNAATGADFTLAPIVLPIAISFFTFQQIAYLMDSYRHGGHEYSLLDYTLFVSFFPQLIAGPIVHHSEILPQLMSKSFGRIKAIDLAVGLSIFSIGLFKKVILADSVAVYVSPVFLAAGAGTDLTMMDAWVGALAFTLQLYFDFSGYADMAIGLGRMFGIRLPLNFYSPYKATSIIDFWRRWHITLSRFLRIYLYIPLGGNRKGPRRRYFYLMVTMLLGGLWHGAGWTFIIWGGLHGAFLVINHSWRARTGWHNDERTGSLPIRWASRVVTFAAVVVAWVVFRAESMSEAWGVLRAMAGLDGVQTEGQLTAVLDGAGEPIALILALIMVVWCTPNTYEIMSRYRPALDSFGIASAQRSARGLLWRPTVIWALALGIATALSIGFLARTTAFLYYRF